MIWLTGFVIVILLAAYFRLPLTLWTLALAVMMFVFQLYGDASNIALTILWTMFAIVFVPLNVKTVRRSFISRPVYRFMAKIMPQISQTEQEALDAGDVWWEADLFSGKPDFSRIHQLP
ncbi:MAG: acyl-CoA dehydrogenase, partial [Gammaproteobacteria bacterium]|nr:acyl-CoA dehydrogenase [Gammaproteobacteria bacterium]